MSTACKKFGSLFQFDCIFVVCFVKYCCQAIEHPLADKD